MTQHNFGRHPQNVLGRRCAWPSLPAV